MAPPASMTNPPQKTAVPIMQSARREMLCRHVGDLCAREFGALPPIEFDSRSDARLRKVARVAKTGHSTRAPACAHLTQCRQIHVVVMVVRDQEQVYAGQCIQALSRLPHATRAGKGNWAASLRPNWVGEHADTADLQQERRVTDEGG